MRIANGTWPGVQKSERPLLICYTRCKCSLETSHYMYLVKSLINGGCHWNTPQPPPQKKREKKNLTQSYDINPYTNRTSKATTQRYRKKFDYTKITDRLTIVSWSDTTGVVHLVYGLNLPIPPQQLCYEKGQTKYQNRISPLFPVHINVADY